MKKTNKYIKKQIVMVLVVVINLKMLQILMILTVLKQDKFLCCMDLIIKYFTSKKKLEILDISLLKWFTIGSALNSYSQLVILFTFINLFLLARFDYFLFYIIVSILGQFYPIVYCLHLFDIIVRLFC